MARRKTLGKQYYKNRQKNYSKKAVRRRSAKKGKRLGAGHGGMLKKFLGVKRRTRVVPHPSAVPVVSVEPRHSAVPVGPIHSTSTRPRSTVVLSGTTSAPRHQDATSAKSRILADSALIKYIDEAIEELYRGSPEIFDFTQPIDPLDPFPQITTTNPYNTMYSQNIKLFLQYLPTTENFDENEVILIMTGLHEKVNTFKTKIVDYLESSNTGITPVNRRKLDKCVRLLNQMAQYSHTEQYFTQHI